MAIHSSGQTVFSLTHIEGITVDADEVVDEVGWSSKWHGCGWDRWVGDRASEGEVAGKHEAYFTAGSLARKEARGGTRGTGTKVSSDKELTEVGRMAEGD